MGTGRLTRTREGYEFLAGSDPYSAGVVARPGYEIVRVASRVRPGWRQGFGEIEEFLTRRQRPLAALCGVELRSPAAMTFDGFAHFNGGYHTMLADLDLLVDGHNPLARTNVVPSIGGPDEVVLHAFSFTIESPRPEKTFVTSGAGELRADRLDSEAIVAPDDRSAAGWAEKARHVMNTMSDRLTGLGVGWSDATVIDVYMDEAPAVALAEVLPRVDEAARLGIHWLASVPPIAGLDFEMDVRGVRRELVGTSTDA